MPGQKPEPAKPEVSVKENGRVTATFAAKADASAPRSAITLSGKAVAAYNDQVLEAQKLMKERGIDPGPLDGKEGPLTREAIKKYAEDTGQDPKAITLDGMIKEMQENAPKAPEVAANAGPADGKPAAVVQAPETPSNAERSGGTVFTRTDPDTGKQVAAGTQTMKFDQEQDSLVIVDAKGNTPQMAFGAAATGQTPQPTPTLEIAPDLLQTNKVQNTGGLRLGG